MPIKKTVKEVSPEKVQKETKQEEPCTACNGTGLLDTHTLCIECAGSGKI